MDIELAIGNFGGMMLSITNEIVELNFVTFTNLYFFP